MEKKQPSEKQINYAKSLGIENPDKYDMNTLSGMIEANMGSTEGFEKPGAVAPPTEKTWDGEESTRDHKYDKDPTGLAVEVFVAVIGMNPVSESKAIEELMNASINLVKQARDAFK